MSNQRTCTERVVAAQHAEPGAVVVVPAVGHIAVPVAATSRSNTTGRSMKTTCLAVSAKSCIIVSAGTSSGRLIVSSPLASAR